jgi:RNAse (barnase) inhibitor barstar
MSSKRIGLDANKFSTLSSFYREVEKEFTKDLNWRIGRNLDAFNDVLRGGFGVHDYEEPFRFTWLHSDKSRKDLGWKETAKYLRKKLTTCHPSNVESIKRDLELAKNSTGKTLFEIIVGIIEGHPHIVLSLE